MMKFSGVVCYPKDEYHKLQNEPVKKTFYAKIGEAEVGYGYYKYRFKDAEKIVEENPDFCYGRRDFRVFKYENGKMKFSNFYPLTSKMHFNSYKRFYRKIDYYKKKHANLTDDIVVNRKTNIFGFKRLRYCNNQMNFTMPFALYKPEKLQDKIPLVIFLHGYTNGGETNIIPFTECLGLVLRIKRKMKKNPCMMLVPSIPKYSAYFTPADGSDNKSFEGNFNELSNKLIKEYPIDEKRIYIIGCSNGAGGTWSQLRLHPERYAAAIPMMGWCDDISDEFFESIKDVPIWAVHAENDTNVKIGEIGHGFYGSDFLVDGLKKAGSKKIKYTRYTKHGHSAAGVFMRKEDWHSWLFEQSK